MVVVVLVEEEVVDEVVLVEVLVEELEVEEEVVEEVVEEEVEVVVEEEVVVGPQPPIAVSQSAVPTYEGRVQGHPPPQ